MAIAKRGWQVMDLLHTSLPAFHLSWHSLVYSVLTHCAARGLSTHLLFGLNAGMLGILAWRMTPSLTSGLVLAALFIASSEMLQVHAVAMSEPLFIFLSLLSFWMFDLYFERPPSSVGRGVAGEWWWLVACATFAGWAYLTRYAGLALAATFIVAISILRTNWRKRFTSIGIFLAGFLPWALGWAIRNRIVAGNATNRTFAWHPITSENLTVGRVRGFGISHPC